MSHRGHFVTKLGVIAATVGSAVGLGNIWRFPYITGTNGGGAFLAVYIICILLLGIPVMCAEFIIGRHAKLDAIGSIKKLAPHTLWHYIGYLAVAASVLILGYYTVIAGWTTEYLVQSVTGQLNDKTADVLKAELEAFTTHPYRPLIWTYIVLLVNYIILKRGIQKGLEKASNILMPLLFVIMILFSIRSLTLPGASEGLRFFLQPDFHKITPTVILEAMGQAFFSLSLGMGILLTYSSYFSNKTVLIQTAGTVALLDAVVAILAGIVIFPAVFSIPEVSPEQGSNLVFATLPYIFGQMPASALWSSLFFLLLLIAALTSTLSLFEVSIAFCTDHFKMSRRSATGIMILIAGVLCTLCSLSIGTLSHLTIGGKNIFDIFDFVSAVIILPLNGLLISIFVGWYLDRKLCRNELTNHGTISAGWYRSVYFCIRYIAPALILLIFLSGLGLF